MTKYDSINASGNSNNIIGDQYNIFNLTAGNGAPVPQFQTQMRLDSMLLVAASDKDQSHFVDQLLDQGANYKHVDDLDETALHKAVKYQATNTINILLADRARAIYLLSARAFEQLETPLHLACRLGLARIVEQLVYYDAPLEARQKIGRTPFFVAVRGNHWEVAEILIKWGVNPVARDFDNNLPLSMAAAFGLVEPLKGLLKLDKVLDHIEWTNRAGETAVLLAASFGRDAALQVLIDRGANIHAVKQKSGTNVLHYLARKGSLGMLTDILPRFSLTEIQQVSNESTEINGTPEDVARRFKHRDCQILLLEEEKRRSTYQAKSLK